jgi:hypothetical protein
MADAGHREEGFQTKGFVVAATGVVPYYDTTFFFVNGSCYCLKALYPLSDFCSHSFIPLTTTTSTTMPDPTQAPTKSKSAAPAPPTPRKVRFNVGMYLSPLLHRLLFTHIALKAPNTKSSMSLVKAPMGSCALPCIDQVVARWLSRRSPLSTIQCSACGPFGSLSSSSS